METETKKFIVDCINQHRGDDLARAKLSFRNFSLEQMQENHGQSGQTRQQILDGYAQREKRCDEAITAIETN